MAELATHLGGHMSYTHLDDGALNWLIKDFNVKSFLDVGCGPGGMVKLAKQKGLKVKGIDGDYTLKRECSADYILHDYTTGSSGLEETFDVGWSVEFVEHVEEKYIPNYVKDFTLVKYLILTFAPPGWPGHHHVNCQYQDYWIKKFGEYGLMYNKEYTKELRSVTSMNLPPFGRTPPQLPNSFIKDRGLFFENARFKS